MSLVVLIAWIIQGSVGVWLLTGWVRHGDRTKAKVVFAHVIPVVTGLGFWIWFTASENLAPAWIAFALITFGNTFGDMMLLRRARDFAPDAHGLWARYGVVLAAIFRGQLPAHVAFHALFSAVVYFGCLGVCIGASIAAAR